MTRVRVRWWAAGVGLALIAGCSSDDLANKALEDAGVEVNTRGGVPSDFPADVPLPDLTIESAVSIGAGWVMRLTSPDAVADIAAYRSKLEAAGYAVSAAFDNSAGDAHNVGFTASDGTWKIQPVAFTQDTPVDGGYMGLTVDPADAAAPGPSASSSGSGAGLPTGFPSDVPIPDLRVETASEFAGGYRVKMTSPDAVADIAAYKAKLQAAGFEITDEFDLSATESRNVGLEAAGAGWEVGAVAFTQDHDGGAYLSLSVDPAG